MSSTTEIAKAYLPKGDWYDFYSDKYENLKNILFHIRTGSDFPDFESIDLNDINRVVVHPVKASPTGSVQKEV